MTKKNKILISAFGALLLASVFVWFKGYNLFTIIVPGLIALFLFYALWDPPKRYRIFSYKDQQRAMRAFDCSEQIDMGKPDWAKDKEKHKKQK
jgi:hypothetical protein